MIFAYYLVTFFILYSIRNLVFLFLFLFFTNYLYLTGYVAHTCNPCTLEAEVGRSRVLGHLGPIPNLKKVYVFSPWNEIDI
jgi:hypothetical protein